MNDIFRPVYRELSDEELSRIAQIKDQARVLYETLNSGQPSREMSLAKTNLEQAVMWAIKAITA